MAAGAVGLLLAAPATVLGLELGEASIASALGQPLRVTIPYRLATNERITPACVSLVPAALDALPTYTSVTSISVGATHIEIVDAGLVREPMIGLNVAVSCPSTPHLVRSYALFVDPPAQLARHADGPSSSTTATATAGASRPTAAPSRTTPAPRAGTVGATLAQGETYRVVRGDTLLGIAARVAQRSTIREAADAIFAANPGAFARGNPNLLKAGSTITIPVMTAPSRAPIETATPTPVVVPPSATDVAPTPPVATTPSTPNVTSIPSVSLAETARLPTDPAEPAPAAADLVDSDAPPVPTPEAMAADAPNAASGHGIGGWIARVALGAAALLMVPLALVRMRKRRQAAAEERQARPSRPRRLVDPIAGISVVEGRLERLEDAPVVAPSDTAAPPFRSSTEAADFEGLAASIATGDAVDIDVGTPTVIDDSIDWFGDQLAAEEDTTRLPDLPHAVASVSSHPPIGPLHDDERLTLTHVELDLLRQDYETERTLTQQSSPALREAVASLEAIPAPHDALADTATLERALDLDVGAADDTVEAPTARIAGK